MQYSFREVIIADSVRTYAIEADAGGTPLTPTLTLRSCNDAVATVTPVSDAPLLRTGFYIKGVSYGTTCIIATAGDVADTTQVATFPHSIVISSGPDTLFSGASAVFGYAYRDARGNAVTGVPEPTFSSSDTTRAQVQAAPLGSVVAFSPGVVTLTVSGVGSPSGGISGSKGLLVEPGTFAGGLTPASGDPGDTVRLTKAATGPGFDADTRAFFGSVRAFTFGVTADSMKVIVPGIGTAGSVPLLMTLMGSQNLAQKVSFTSNTASLADPYDAVNDDPTTAPPAGNGDHYIVLQGNCVDGVGGAGDDCDDFFTLTNGLARPDTITVRADWFTGADVDILFCNAGCTAFVGGFAGATSANPEQATVVIPAGTTWRLWLNLFAPDDNTLVRVRVSGQG